MAATVERTTPSWHDWRFLVVYMIAFVFGFATTLTTWDWVVLMSAALWIGLLGVLALAEKFAKRKRRAGGPEVP